VAGVLAIIEDFFKNSGLGIIRIGHFSGWAKVSNL
jgi:hypothetical protein